MRPKSVVGRVNLHVLQSAPICGAERQNPLGCFTDVAHDASSGRTFVALRLEWAFERWPRYRGPTNMRCAFESSSCLFQTVALSRAAA
jgi:hypothetical protein